MKSIMIKSQNDMLREIKKIANIKDGKCISSEYINNKKKLNFICKYNHTWSAIPSKIKAGQWCPFCSGNQKLTINDMKKLANGMNGECLSDTYVNSKSKLLWQCKKGHQWWTIPDRIRNGFWCRKCKEVLTYNKRERLIGIKEIAINKGGKCLSSTYTNNSTKLEFICEKKHKWFAAPEKIKSGSWCPKCSGNQKLTINIMKDIASSRGGECKSKKYINGKSKLLWRCKEDHEWWAIPDSIRRGSWCQICHGNYQHNLEMMKEIAKIRGGKCISNSYVNNSTDLLWECSDGHQFKATPNRVRSSGRWCPTCSSSLGERICRELFEQIFSKKFPKYYPEWLINEEGNRMELDGYNKNLKLAFEHQGEQHYSLNTHFIKSKKKLDRRKHFDKLKVKLCNDHNITLIPMPEIQVPVEISHLKIVIKKLLLEKHVKLPANFDSKKITIERAYISRNLVELQELAIERKGKYCEKVYKGALQPVKWSCKYNHTWLAAPASVKSGSWCRECSYIERGKKKRLSIDEFHKIAKERGGRCLSEVYINSYTKLLWECSKGHQWKTTPENVKSGKWCRKCAGIERLTIEEMHDIAKANGGKCLSKIYINGKKKKNGNVKMAIYGKQFPVA